jgi:hypothetical protein
MLTVTHSLAVGATIERTGVWLNGVSQKNVMLTVTHSLAVGATIERKN